MTCEAFRSPKRNGSNRPWQSSGVMRSYAWRNVFLAALLAAARPLRLFGGIKMNSTIKRISIGLMGLLLFSVGSASADQDEDSDTRDTTAEASDTGTEGDTEEINGSGMSGSEKRAAKDQAIAKLVEEHNEAVEKELDEVVCERVSITGTRRKVRVCKTKREIAAEQESAQRMLLQRNRASSDPRQAEGSGATN